MESFIRNVDEIEGDLRRWVESGLGQRLRQNQRVMVTVLNVGVEPDEETRRQALEELRGLRVRRLRTLSSRRIARRG